MNLGIRLSYRRMLTVAAAMVAMAMMLVSCGRSIPTAPALSTEPVTRTDGADPFATSGLENQVVITVAQGASAAQLAKEYGAIVVSSEQGERTAALRPVSGQTPTTLMNQLSLDGRVVTSEPNQWIEPAEARQRSFAFDDGFGSAQTFEEQPVVQMLGLGRAHDIATGKGVKVAIIDTGVDLMHPQLRRHIVGGWDFVGNDANPTDQRDFIDNDRDGNVDEAFGHGTHVAGIIRLVAPDAQLLIVRVLDADGRGDLVNVAAGVRWAVEQGAKVINLSLGSTRNTDALQNVLEDAENSGVIIVSAAGNWGTTSVDFPGGSSHATCVAAVDANCVTAPFSSYGSEVELAAPGVAIRSTFPGGGYKLWSGTSMAAPFVAGTAALLAEKHPLWTMAEMEARMQKTSLAVTGANAPKFGKGALSVYRSLAPDWVPGPNRDPAPEDPRPR